MPKLFSQSERSGAFVILDLSYWLGALPAPFTLLVIVGAFLIGGLVKGLIGGGLPSIVVPIMALVVDPVYAAAVTLIPVMATNIFQAVDGRRLLPVMRRFWAYFLCLAVGVAAGSQILVGLPPQTAALLIGFAVILMSPVAVVSNRFNVSARRETWLNPVIGGSVGVLGGTTVIFTPVLIYFAAVRIDKDAYVTAAALTAIFCMVPLYLGLGFSSALSWEITRASLILLVPTMAGYFGGRALRGAVSERAFRIILTASLALVGVGLIYKGLFS